MPFNLEYVKKLVAEEEAKAAGASKGPVYMYNTEVRLLADRSAEPWARNCPLSVMKVTGYQGECRADIGQHRQLALVEDSTRADRTCLLEKSISPRTQCTQPKHQ